MRVGLGVEAHQAVDETRQHEEDDREEDRQVLDSNDGDREHGGGDEKNARHSKAFVKLA